MDLRAERRRTRPVPRGGRPLITFFSIPKAFEGDTARMQRNAIGSWLRAVPEARVVLFGADAGVAEAARSLGAEHVPEITRTEHGAPRLDGAFARAAEVAESPMLCYVNADIVLLDDFGDAVQRLAALEPPLLAVGESWDAPLDAALDFEGDWRRQVRESTNAARRRGAGALDYFVFTRGLYGDLPPFAVGRVGFDNWLVWKAGASGARVIDMTPSVRPVHQRHDYSHVTGGRRTTRAGGTEGRRNIELAGSKSHLHTRFDATHLLGRRRLRRNLLRPFRLKENLRKAVYKGRTLTPWPPADWKRERE